MNCPICQHQDIPTLVTTCPNCATNLVGLKMINALEEQYVEVVKTKVNSEGDFLQQKKGLELAMKKKNSRNNWLLFLLFLLPFLYYFFGRTAPKEIVKTVKVESDSLKTYKDKLIEKELQITNLEASLNKMETTKNIRELKYAVKKGDILNELGKLFYNDSLAAYQIAKDNKIYDIKGLPIGDTLTIKYRD